MEQESRGHMIDDKKSKPAKPILKMLPAFTNAAEGLDKAVDDLNKVVKKARKLGLTVSLYTNGDNNREILYNDVSLEFP